MDPIGLCLRRLTSDGCYYNKFVFILRNTKLSQIEMELKKCWLNEQIRSPVFREISPRFLSQVLCNDQGIVQKWVLCSEQMELACKAKLLN